MLRRNLARQTSNWSEYNDHMAFNIYLIEKEMGVGPITDEFPLMKFWNLLDEDNIKCEKEMIERSNKRSGSNTLG